MIAPVTVLSEIESLELSPRGLHMEMNVAPPISARLRKADIFP